MSKSMSVLKIIKMGNKQLSTPSESISAFKTPELKELLENMSDTLQEKAGVGIAAPQIGVNKRVIMFGFNYNARYPNEEPVAHTVLINPGFEILDHNLVDGWEGCLSVPGLRGLVPRYKKIKYWGYDYNGYFIEKIAQGFHARVFQHEYDHIEGILYPTRLKDTKFFGYEDELEGIYNVA
jgi:peptide deformylase